MNTLKSAQTQKRQGTQGTQGTLFFPEKCLQNWKSASKCLKIIDKALFIVLIKNKLSLKVPKVPEIPTYYCQA